MKATLHRWYRSAKAAGKRWYARAKSWFVRNSQTAVEEVVQTTPAKRSVSRSFSAAATKTRPQAWGSMSMRRYGSFASKAAAPIATGGGTSLLSGFISKDWGLLGPGPLAKPGIHY